MGAWAFSVTPIGRIRRDEAVVEFGWVLWIECGRRQAPGGAGPKMSIFQVG